MTEPSDVTADRPRATPAVEAAEAAMEAVEHASDAPVTDQVAALSRAQAALADLLADDADPSPERP